MSELIFSTIDALGVQHDENNHTTPGGIKAVVESEVRRKRESPSWRCQDENEHQIIKDIAEKKLLKGARVLRDKYYPITVDGVSRLAVLDEYGETIKIK